MAADYEGDAREAVEQCLLIVELLDDEIDEETFNKSPSFFESVRDGVVSISETIGNTHRVTPNQRRALDNWEAGVRKWLR